MAIIQTEPHLSPKEAVDISYNHGTIDVITFAKSIADEWRGGQGYKDGMFDYYCMLAAIYTAGYMHGKQEERARKRKGATQ